MREHNGSTRGIGYDGFSSLEGKNNLCFQSPSPSHEEKTPLGGGQGGASEWLQVLPYTSPKSPVQLMELEQEFLKTIAGESSSNLTQETASESQGPEEEFVRPRTRRGKLKGFKPPAKSLFSPRSSRPALGRYSRSSTSSKQKSKVEDAIAVVEERSISQNSESTAMDDESVSIVQAMHQSIRDFSIYSSLSVSDSVSSSQTGKSRSSRRNTTGGATTTTESQNGHLKSSSRKRRGGSGGGGARISIRQHRAQEKASVTIQKMARRFMAKIAYRKNRIQKDYLDYAWHQKYQHRLQSQKLKSVEDQIVEVFRQTQSEIQTMRRNTEEEKTILGRAMRTIVRSNMKNQSTSSQNATHQSMSVLNQLAEVEKEEVGLKAEARELEETMAQLNEEHETLKKANDQVRQIFASLNQYAKVKVEENKELAAQRVMIAEVLMPKCKEDRAMVNTACMLEAATKSMYREGMYKQAQGIRGSPDHDALLYLHVMDKVRDCEEGLGNEILNITQTWEALKENLREDEDSDTDDSDMDY